MTNLEYSVILLPNGAVAQLGERLPRTEKAGGSNPLCSTILDKMGIGIISQTPPGPKGSNGKSALVRYPLSFIL